LMLRAMMQARYSEKNLGHFGLASAAYAHFTSPIRRYADLVVHRQLRNLFFERGNKITHAQLEKIATRISEQEIKATEIERKIDRIFAATFMSSHVGEIFLAVIVSCTDFGMFVRILEHHVEGLVHISTISRHHVIFLPERMSLAVSKSNEIYMVGDKIKVKLTNVNVERGHIDFELVKGK
jgi:ribonuclease R